MDKQTVKREFADKLIAKYSSCDITRTIERWRENNTDFEGVCLIIKHPYSADDIRIMYDGNHVTSDEIMLSYMYWHKHIFNYYFPESETEKHADYFVGEVSEYIDVIFQGRDLSTLL